MTDTTRLETLSTLLGELSADRREAVDDAVRESTDAADLRARLVELSIRQGERPGISELDDDEEVVPVTLGSDDGGAVDRLQSTVGGLRNRVTSGLGAVGSSMPSADRGDDPPVETTDETAADVDDDAPLPTRSADTTGRPLARVRGRARSGVAELKYTARNADPKQAALWGLATGVTLANPALTAGYSTAVLLSGAVLGGGAVGAYASSHENTVFDDVDPLEMARRSRGMAAANAHRTNLDGAALGSLLGASTYLAETLTPEEYAHWLAGVDADLVARGAELGAGRATDDDLGLGTSRTGAILGGGFGLAYGLAGGDDEADEGALRELLDDDLYEEYSRALDESKE
ncbi:hypothetical protein [Haloprofundus halophilus]|uniref:hypothetical protein n=1 Tax=Haloprofundus halophilus TaxID=2283527 RepID=UPI000E44E6BC|nr:hypothetical protein [Haloprofundus halophilus]